MKKLLTYQLTMKKHVRHGDINFVEVSKSEGEIVKHDGSFVVGLGETTGHRHILKVKNPDDLVIKKDSSGNYYFELLAEGELTHEEHKTLKVLPAIYKKIQEREVDHFNESLVRKVID